MRMWGAAPKTYKILVAILVIATYELFIQALPRQQAVTIDNVLVVVAAAAGAVACGWFAWRNHGWERWWRALGAAGLTTLAAGQSAWLGYELGDPEHANAAYWDDLCYAAGLPMAVAALVIVARHASLPPVPGVSARARMLAEARLVLDGLLIVGSLLLLSWMTLYRTVAGQEPAGQGEFLTAFWSSFADVLMIALVLLTYTTRVIPRRNLRQFFLIGAGLTLIAVSDLAFSSYLAGAIAYPLAADLGYLAAPLLIALAASRQFQPARSSRHQAPRATQWPALIAPYLPLVIAMVLFYEKVVSGATLHGLETASAVAIFVLVALRQVVAFRSVRLGQAATAEDSEVTFGRAAQRILGSSTAGSSAQEPHLPEYVLYLRDEHRKHIEMLQRSGNRTALWTFAGGVLLGLLGNVVVAVVLG
ncbi:hypothetical protein [Paractinoplanes lichenicola]|uniref:Uncharacterized protein n=1 Tax=Paractinoplanes lichenicola TaxID=2802976 RepID=A0ABS1VZU8_9ACTN|nr:hypothetical protein [Actinoplanes lichenicola]MBL7260025.1 hypothetical protein [Actinoplanes lichenicola]